MKKRKWLIAAGAALAVIAAFCLWYTHVSRNWADISHAGQISSLSWSIYYDDGKLQGYSTDQLEVQGTHPAAQAVISALEKHTYRADLVNLNPIPQDPVRVPEVNSISLMMHTPEKLITVAIHSNGQFYTDTLSSSPRCYSYQTDTGLFQEVLDILLEYGAGE